MTQEISGVLKINRENEENHIKKGKVVSQTISTLAPMGVMKPLRFSRIAKNGGFALLLCFVLFLLTVFSCIIRFIIFQCCHFIW